MNKEEFIKNANKDNLAFAKAKVEEVIATEEQEKLAFIYSGLLSDLETCNRVIKQHETFKDELMKKIKPFNDAKLKKK